MILLLDNYDSFTYNLVHLVEKVCAEQVTVLRNDEITVPEAGQYSRIIFSPGPGLPSEAGVMQAVIKEYAGKKPMLGVCLGMQGIAEAYGASLLNLSEVFHGVSRLTRVTGDDLLFHGCPAAFSTGRYHSWAVDESTLPPELVVTARDEEGLVMAIAHREHDVRGVQFHPESILSEHGELMMLNWMRRDH